MPYKRSTAEVVDTEVCESPVTAGRMENSLEKLKCLDYEVHFVQRLHQNPVGRNTFLWAAQNTSLQFNHFIELVKWLISIIKGDDGGLEIDELDDPNTIIGKLMLVLQDLGFDAAFPVTKLKQAHGEAALAVLDFLTDKGLEAKEFTFEHPIYFNDKDTDQEDAVVYDEDEIVDEADSFVEEEDDYLDNFMATAGETFADGTRRDSSHQIIESKIDPLEWRTELERVAPRLRVQATQQGTDDWRSHIDQMRTQEEMIAATFPATYATLERMSKDLAAVLERIRSKEKAVNDSFREVVQEFLEVKAKMEVLEESHKASSSRVSDLSNELAHVVETLEEVKSAMNDKGNSMTDTTPLVQMKQALTKLKAEVKDFDLRIGVLSHTLLQSQLHRANPQEHSSINIEEADDLSDEADH